MEQFNLVKTCSSVQQFLNTQNPNTVPTRKSVYDYFTIQRLPNVATTALYYPVNGAELGYTFFWVTGYEKSKKCNKVSLMSLLSVSPTLWEFSNYTRPLSQQTKKSSQITKSSNCKGISVKALRKFWKDRWIFC